MCACGLPLARHTYNGVELPSGEGCPVFVAVSAVVDAEGFVDKGQAMAEGVQLLRNQDGMSARKHKSIEVFLMQLVALREESAKVLPAASGGAAVVEESASELKDGSVMAAVEKIAQAMQEQAAQALVNQRALLAMQESVDSLTGEVEALRQQEVAAQVIASVPWQHPGMYQKELMMYCVKSGVAPSPHQYSIDASLASRSMFRSRQKYVLSVGDTMAGGAGLHDVGDEAKDVAKELRVPALTRPHDIVAAVGRMAACFDGDEAGAAEGSDLREFQMVLLEVWPQVGTSQMLEYIRKCFELYFDTDRRGRRPSGALTGIRHDQLSIILTEKGFRCGVCGSVGCAHAYKGFAQDKKLCRQYPYVKVPRTAITPKGDLPAAAAGGPQ